MTTSQRNQHLFYYYPKSQQIEPQNRHPNPWAADPNQRYSAVKRPSMSDDIQGRLFSRGPSVKSEPTLEQRNQYLGSVTPAITMPNMFDYQPDPYGGNQMRPYPTHEAPFQSSEMRSKNHFLRNFEGERQNMIINSIKSNLISPKMFHNNIPYSNSTEQMRVNQGQLPPNMMHPTFYNQNMIMANMIRFKNAYQKQMIENARNAQKKQQEQERNEIIDRMIDQLDTQCEVLKYLTTNSNEGFNEVRMMRNIKGNLKGRRSKVSENKDFPSQLASTAQSQRTRDRRMIRDSSRESFYEQDWTESQGLSFEQSHELSRDEIQDSSYEQETRVNPYYSNKRYAVSLQSLSPKKPNKTTKYPSQEYYSGTGSNRYDSHQEIDEIESDESVPVGLNENENEKYPSIHGDVLDKSNSEEEEDVRSSLPRAQSEIFRPGKGLFDYSRKRNENEGPLLSLPSLTRLDKENERPVLFLQTSEKSHSKSAGFDEITPTQGNPRQRSLILPKLQAIRHRGELAGLNAEASTYSSAIQDGKGNQKPQLQEETKADQEQNKLGEVQKSETITGPEASRENKPEGNSQSKKKKGKKGKKKSRKLTKKNENARSNPENIHPSINARVLIPQDENVKEIWSMFPVTNNAQPLQKVEQVIAPRRVPLLSTEDTVKIGDLPEIIEETEQSQQISKRGEVLAINATVREESANKEVITPTNKTILEPSRQQEIKFSKIKSVPLEKRPYENIVGVRLPQSRLFGRQSTEELGPVGNSEQSDHAESLALKKVQSGTSKEKKSLFNYLIN